MDLVPSAWSLWVAAALTAGVLEAKLSNFVMIWFAVGGLVSAVLARFGAPVELQLGAFTVTSAALYGLSRTVFRRFLMRGGQPLRTGVEAMVGREALVVEALTETGGSVRINGELWGARSLDGPLPTGVPVRVEQVDGLRLYVRRPLAPVFAASVTRKELP